MATQPQGLQLSPFQPAVSHAASWKYLGTEPSKGLWSVSALQGGGSEPPSSGFLISKEHAHSLAVHTVHRDCQSSPHCKPVSKKGFNSHVRNVSSPWRRSLFQMGVLSGWKWRKNSPHAKLHPPPSFPKDGRGAGACIHSHQYLYK